jgi:hypothetical protein
MVSASLKRKHDNSSNLAGSAALPPAKVRRAIDEAEEVVKSKATGSSVYASLFSDKTKANTKSEAESYFNRGTVRYIM